ncbi:hypothetical protein GNP82_08495 [Aliivibrio fischeri]|uniref:hypothetical protein n=1 Tax=Aliivibrio fischeri TaxID=668 RepID=UPI0012D97DB1|nr:hypothetical protein [Aliivibrio fischeri]MUK37589.1 hypothetical protein [Aliivibrio fischeri]
MYSPDEINYFSLIGKRYPQESVINSKERIFMSLFSFNQNYLIIKVLDSQSIQNITDVSLSIYREGCAMVLGTHWRTKLNSSNFTSLIPVNPKLVDFPIFPSSDEVATFEAHFVDAITGVLLKVINFTPQSNDFTASFVGEYNSLSEEPYETPHFARSFEKFNALSLSAMGESIILSSPCSIIKKDSEKDEPQFFNLNKEVKYDLSLEEAEEEAFLLHAEDA